MRYAGKQAVRDAVMDQTGFKLELYTEAEIRRRGF